MGSESFEYPWHAKGTALTNKKTEKIIYGKKGSFCTCLDNRLFVEQLTPRRLNYAAIVLCKLSLI